MWWSHHSTNRLSIYYAPESNELSMKKGASSWLTILPLEKHDYALHKQAFRDALALRYGWLPTHIPAYCSCGQPFSMQHVLLCPKGGYPSICHNELRDLTAFLLSEICHGVAIEPSLQPITSETLHHTTTKPKMVPVWTSWPTVYGDGG